MKTNSFLCALLLAAPVLPAQAAGPAGASPMDIHLPQAIDGLRQAALQYANQDAFESVAPSLAKNLGADYRGQGVFWFSTPIPAKPFIDAMGWVRAYAVSGDVHQYNWQLRLWQADLADPYQSRIATVEPGLGAWVVRVELDARPQGELPQLAAGASPAYDLARYPASIRSVQIRLADEARTVRRHP